MDTHSFLINIFGDPAVAYIVWLIGFIALMILGYNWFLRRDD